MACNLNQDASERMVNLQKVSDDPEAQLKYLDAAIARNKQEASLYTRRAKLLLQKGELDKALSDVNEAIEQDDKDMTNLFLKAQVLRAMGKYKAALPFALQAERNSYQSAALYILLSDLYLHLQQPQKASAAVKKAMELAPENAHALYFKGRVAAATSDTAGAVINYKLAIRQQPAFAEARRDLVSALVNQKVYDEARLQLEKVIKQLPKDAITWFYKGQFYQAIQKPDSALWSYRTALELADTLQNAHYNAGVILYSQGDNAGAISHFEKANEAYKNNIKYITLLAGAYERTGQNINALEQYQRLLASQPGNGYTFADQRIARLKAKLSRPAPVVADTTTYTE
ncbi:tetratricopeptide repeat protein [Pontibacter sp. H259]|uniref:tetratricopeptide repeat protein n=1 Tax=Pontibacter sp. H259 TaxID=3133421 RepID=UPI0030C42360